jgi:hypothetical protein
MIHKTHPNRCVICATCLLVSMAGCGGKTLQTVPVHGKVTWKGQPITSGDVGFHPQKLAVEGPHRIAVARLDGEGKYTLSTVTHGDGVQPGKYAVVVITREGGRILDGGENLKPSPLPPKYSAVNTTPLEADIPADAKGPLEFNFDIKD